MKEIKIDENVLKYSEQMLPLVIKMTFFISLQQELYDTFHQYKGGAKKEIDEYAKKQLNQLTLMCNGYSVLAENLNEIIAAFKCNDEASKQKIEAYAINVQSSIDKEKTRMQSIMHSLG